MTLAKDKQHFDLKRVFALCFAVYAVLIIAFYFLAGDQLHFRRSRGEVTMPAAEAGTIELVQDTYVQQTFTAKIQRLESVSVQWGTYYRANTGAVTMALYRGEELLGQQTFDAAGITEGGVTTLTFDTPLEGLADVPLTLRLWADSATGSAVSPMMNTSAPQTEGFTLDLNGTAAAGTLCFSAGGEDYIWTGLHYWEFAAAFGLLLAAYLFWSYRYWQQGKPSALVKAVVAVQKYRFLIKQLVDRDFKAKYKRSVLGVFWSFLNPLLNMAVQYVVFSNLFRFDIPYFPVYLLCGNVIFTYFSESCGMALTSIVGNASLITKVYVPKYIYPLTRILSSLINLLISMIPLIVVALISGLLPVPAYILSLYAFVCLALFCLGMGLFLSAAMVFFRDIQFLWNVLTTIWMYLTPIFYPVSALPEAAQRIVMMNPLYYYVTFVRTCIIGGMSPEPTMYAQCLLYAIVALVIGAWVFKRNQNKFVLYL